jgi:hypothetical protein
MLARLDNRKAIFLTNQKTGTSKNLQACLQIACREPDAERFKTLT